MAGCRVCLQWEAPAERTSSFKIERKVGDGPFALLTSIEPGASLRHDLAVVPGASYTYRICARSDSSVSDYSPEVSVVRPSPLPCELVVWGSDADGLISQAPRSERFIAVSSGAYHALALRPDGTLAAWGRNNYGQVTTAPTDARFVQIAAGHFHNVALREDGSMAAWGLNSFGCVSDTPEGHGFVHVSAGGSHSLALRADGTAVTWGGNEYGQLKTPTGAFLDADCGGIGSVALRADGTLVYWGWPDSGQFQVPEGNDFVSVAGGYATSIGVKADGRFVVWGADSFDLVLNGTASFAPTEPGFVAVVEGHNLGIALRPDGSMVPWGRTDNGLIARHPAGPGFTAVSIGDLHAAALRKPPDRAPGPFADGSFEVPRLAPGTALLLGGVDHRRLQHWSAAGEIDSVITTGQFLGLSPVDGDAWVEFNADEAPARGSLAQTFQTVTGRRYAVRYTAGKSGRGLGPVGLRTEIVSEDGRVLAQSGHQISETGWQPPAQLSFTAESSRTTLRFTDISTDPVGANVALDAVSVEAASADQ